MPKRQINRLKFSARLLKLGEFVDEVTDRVDMGYPFHRILKYNTIGVTATDKFTTKDTNEIVKKIEVRIDRSIENNQKDYRVEIGQRIYQIERIYMNEAKRLMEVSLSYVD